MTTKPDIEGRDDIEKLVVQFYVRVREYPQLASFFAHVDWEHHIPMMVRFWENTLFHTGNYEGNPMQAHAKLHQAMPMRADDFQVWKSLFIETVDTLFQGEHSEHIKSRAISIATIMQMKILHGS